MDTRNISATARKTERQSEIDRQDRLKRDDTIEKESKIKVDWSAIEIEIRDLFRRKRENREEKREKERYFFPLFSFADSDVTRSYITFDKSLRVANILVHPQRERERKRGKKKKKEKKRKKDNMIVRLALLIYYINEDLGHSGQ